MNKKAIAILGAIFILIVATLGVLLYGKYGKKTVSDNNASSTPISITTSTPVTETVPPISTSTPSNDGSYKVTQLTTGPVNSPILFFDGTGIAYFDNLGNLMQGELEKNGDQLLLTRQSNLQIAQKANISKILWPPRKGNEASNSFIAEFNLGGRKTWSYFNAKTGSYTDLPSQMISVDWIPGGTQIMYAWLAQDGKGSLKTADPDGSNFHFVTDLFKVDNAISVSPDGLNVLLYRQFNTDATNAINLTSFDGKIFRTLVKDGYNYGVLWSPDSQKFLFAQKEQVSGKYQLWYYDLQTGDYKALGLFTTVDKAVWDKDSKYVYAAVPNSGTPGQGVTSDDFYRVDLSSFEKKKYAISGAAVDGENLFLNLDQSKLIFKNGQDGGLYYLDVSK